MPEIIKDTDGAVRVLRISNISKHNAFTQDMANALLDHFDEADEDDVIHVVVVHGEGEKAFSSGDDINELLEGASFRVTPFIQPLKMKKPVIAAVNGLCYGAGFSLALSCDMRIASENAVFCSPGARLGMLPEGGQIARLPIIVNRIYAAEMMMLAEPVSAAEAYRIGFINRMVGEGEAFEEAMAFARRIADNSPAVVSAIKKGLRLGEENGIADAWGFEDQVSLSLRSNPEGLKSLSKFKG